MGLDFLIARGWVERGSRAFSYRERSRRQHDKTVEAKTVIKCKYLGDFAWEVARFD